MRDQRKQKADETAQLDPAALTIALWLALVVSAAAISRISADAIAQANLDEARAMTTPQVARPVPAIPYGT